LNSTLTSSTPSETPFLGLAPFLRLSVAGTDLLPIGQQLLATASEQPENANLWMNLSTVMQCLRQRDIGLAIQHQALALQRIYTLPALQQPAKLRLLMLMVEGDIAENTPLDCLLENTDIDLIFYYVTPENPLDLPLPEHDILLVALSDSDANREILTSLTLTLAAWPKPVINAPQHISNTGRNTASMILQNVPGLLIPPTLRAGRADLLDIATESVQLAARFPACDFPVIVRPVGSQAGRDLARVNNSDEMASYLGNVNEAEFFISRFIDYSGTDGLFRKYRVALIDGKPYACHMAVSSNWMVHYVNAGMYEEAHKRAEEAAFMENFADFAARHQAALNAIYQRTQLDYLCIDCAQTQLGELLIFEIDHTMVVHAMDPEALFPYKQTYMAKVQNAFRDFLFRLNAEQTLKMSA